MSEYFFSLSSVLLISLLSIIAILPLLSLFRRQPRLTSILVSLAVGALLGDTFFHLLPNTSHFTFALHGFLLFFVLEKIIRWRHCHDPQCQDFSYSPKTVISLSIIGDSVHNFLDGLAIAASFSRSLPLGLATSLAVLLHEIPQELGDFGIYLHHSMSLFKAMLCNLLSASFALLGVIIYFQTQIFIGTRFLIPLTAGGFLYLAASDLIPELHRHQAHLSSSLLQLFFISLSLFLIYLLTFLEPKSVLF